MKYTNSREETAVWLCLSMAWMFVAILAWSASVFLAARPIDDGSQLTTLALVLGMISCALRLPILTLAIHSQLSLKYLVWLFGFTANLNWLGFLFLRAQSPAEVVPALLIFLLFEGWLLQRAVGDNCLPWDWGDKCQLLWRSYWLPLIDPLTTADAVTTLDVGGAQESWHEGDIAEDFPDGVTRRYTDGVDEFGRRYLSGDILVELEDEQKVETVVVAFCPAFSNTPQVELEVTQPESPAADDSERAQEEFATRTLACTPTGMRVTLKRNRGKGIAKLWLGWFAVDDPEPGHAQAGQAGVPQTSQILP